MISLIYLSLDVAEERSAESSNSGDQVKHMKNKAKTYSVYCLDIYYFLISLLNRQQISWKNIDWRQQR